MGFSSHARRPGHRDNLEFGAGPETKIGMTMSPDGFVSPCVFAGHLFEAGGVFAEVSLQGTAP